MAWNPALSKEEQVLSVSPPPARDGKNGSSKRGSSSSEMAEEELCDEGMQQLEKKRRLSSEQVKFLEESFEMENKLEPERKLLIAKKLGLQPRQIAVWFQNRRARWKTKQLERDFEALKARYDVVLKENEELQAQVASLNDLLSKKKCVQGQVFGTVLKQEETIPLLSAVNVSSKSLEQSVNKVEELCSKSEVDSLSDQSEVLDSDCYNPPSDLSQFFEESAAGYSDDLLEYYSRFNFLPPAVKLEESMFQEENCNFAFTLEETVLFPCYS